MSHIDIFATIAEWKAATPQMSGDAKSHLREMLDKLMPALERDVREIVRDSAAESPGGRDFWEAFVKHRRKILAECRELRKILG